MRASRAPSLGKKKYNEEIYDGKKMWVEMKSISRFRSSSVGEWKKRRDAVVAGDRSEWNEWRWWQMNERFRKTEGK